MYHGIPQAVGNKKIYVLLDKGGEGGRGEGEGATKPASKLSNYVEQSEPQENTRAGGEAAREGRKTHSRESFPLSQMESLLTG